MIAEIVWLEEDGRFNLKTGEMNYVARFSNHHMAVARRDLKSLQNYTYSYIEDNSNGWIFLNIVKDYC